MQVDGRVESSRSGRKRAQDVLIDEFAAIAGASSFPFLFEDIMVR